MLTELESAIYPVDAMSRLLPARPRLLAIGEPTHGVDTLLDLRNEIFRHLVEHGGYRTIAIESDCLMGLVVDDYITSGTGTLDNAMKQGFSHEWGEHPGNRELVSWMRDYNDGRPTSELVHFAGFDGPLEISAAAGPRQALTALHSYLAHWVDADLVPISAEALDQLIGGDEQWTDPNAMMDPTQSVGRSAEVIELRLLADDLVALLDAQAPHLLAVTSPEDLDRARLYGRTATGLLRYHFWMADTSPSRMARLCGLRDSMMASNLIALAERAPTLTYGHNSHFQRHLSSMQMWGGSIEWWSAGALVSTRLQENYAFIPTAVGTIRHHGVDTPPSDSLEGLLYALPGDRFIVDTAAMAAALDGTRPAARVSPWFGYAPFDPAYIDESETILFVKDTGVKGSVR